MTQKKKKTVRHIIIGIGLLWLIIIIAALVLFRNELRSLMSLEKVDKYGMYQMTYYGDYGFDEFLEVGARNDADIEAFVTKRLLKGLPLDLGVTGDGCTAFVTKNENSSILFGRNFDWGTCTALIVQTSPVEGYDSVSTVNMDFLNLGLRMPEETQMRLLSVAAPFAPMDGMNEKGLCVAVLMIQDSPGFQQDTGKPDLTTTTAVRLLLDQAADVEEAVELLSQYDMHASAGMMVHFALADATGHSVVVE